MRGGVIDDIREMELFLKVGYRNSALKDGDPPRGSMDYSGRAKSDITV
jgi:hypothetical protein